MATKKDAIKQLQQDLLAWTEKEPNEFQKGYVAATASALALLDPTKAVRQCARQGCRKYFIGRSNKRYCSNSCKTIACRLRKPPME